MLNYCILVRRFSSRITPPTPDPTWSLLYLSLGRTKVSFKNFYKYLLTFFTVTTSAAGNNDSILCQVLADKTSVFFRYFYFTFRTESSLVFKGRIVFLHIFVPMFNHCIVKLGMRIVIDYMCCSIKVLQEHYPQITVVIP